MTVVRRRQSYELAPLDYGSVFVQEMPLAKGNGLVGGYQCSSRYCAERGCDYVLISAVRGVRPGARCPRHKKESK